MRRVNRCLAEIAPATFEYNFAMTNRRDALAMAPLLLLQAVASKANAQSKQATPPGPSPLFQHDLPNLTMDDWQVTVSEIEEKPGSVGRAHQHPGFVLVYVLEGAVVTKISGQPQRTYSAGEMFYEPPGSTHEVSNNASDTKPAKFLAFIFAKKGLPLVKPV
jgi:quercetin dioxygenase-like cupin family protein